MLGPGENFIIRGGGKEEEKKERERKGKGKKEEVLSFLVTHT